MRRFSVSLSDSDSLNLDMISRRLGVSRSAVLNYVLSSRLRSLAVQVSVLEDSTDLRRLRGSSVELVNLRLSKYLGD
jgi:hypothetical protein